MNEENLKKWRSRYDEVYDDELQEIEETLNSALPDQRHITREQLNDVIRWKLDAMPGRRDRNIDIVNEIPEAYIEKVSEAAFLIDDPTVQLKTLKSIPGIGKATATVILAFYDPTRYAIGDQYIVHALLDEERQMRISDYPRILEELHARNPADYDLRDVEKAYYQQYRNEHDVGRW